MRAIDFSDNQALSVVASAIDMLQPDLVVIRFYQKIEHAGGRDWTRAAIQIARDKGKPIVGYWWPYHRTDVRACYQDVLDLAEQCGGLDYPLMLADVETYHDWVEGDTIPGVGEIMDMVDEAAKQGKRAAFYSSPPMWARAGNPLLDGADAVGWSANGPTYGQPTPWPDSLDGVAQFGGLEMVGQQFTSVPLDESIFLL